VLIVPFILALEWAYQLWQSQRRPPAGPSAALSRSPVRPAPVTNPATLTFSVSARAVIVAQQL
jgi:hypothetical protein